MEGNMLLFITGLLFACGEKEEDTSVAEETAEESTEEVEESEDTGTSEEGPEDTAQEETSR